MQQFSNAQPVIERSYLTEIALGASPGVGQQINFKDYPQLVPRDRATRAIFYGVSCCHSAILATTPNGLPVLSLAECASLTLTIMDGSVERLYKMPAVSLIDSVQGGFIRLLDGIPVNLTKSYVTVMNGTLPANHAAAFNWYYRMESRIYSAKR